MLYPETIQLLVRFYGQQATIEARKDQGRLLESCTTGVMQVLARFNANS